MCEAKIDWTKPVEYREHMLALWKPFNVLWRSDDFQEIVLGMPAGDARPRIYHANSDQFRNTPPPPPEVWVVWRKQDDKVWYYGTYHEPVRNLPSEDFWQQKVTCEGPIW